MYLAWLDSCLPSPLWLALPMKPLAKAQIINLLACTSAACLHKGQLGAVLRSTFLFLFSPSFLPRPCWKGPAPLCLLLHLLCPLHPPFLFAMTVGGQGKRNLLLFCFCHEQTGILGFEVARMASRGPDESVPWKAVGTHVTLRELILRGFYTMTARAPQTSLCPARALNTSTVELASDAVGPRECLAKYLRCVFNIYQ